MAPIASAESAGRSVVEIDSACESGVLKLRVEFTGGLEMLFSDQRKHKLDVPSTNSAGQVFTINDLIHHLCENMLSPKDKTDVFVLDGTVRPGILVLINDADWELEGEGGCQLQDGDEVVFVSTLHGG